MVADAALPVSVWSQRGRMWWTESRPAESGRNALVCDGQDLWPEVSVRTRVHSYGGGAWWPNGADGVYACDDADGRLWHLSADGLAQPASPEPAFAHGWRYADGRAHGDATVCVRENHLVARQSGGEEANEIVRISGDGSGEPEIVATGADFLRLGPGPAPMVSGWPGSSGTTPTCPGTKPSCGWTASARCRASARWWSPNGDPTAASMVVSDHKGWWSLYWFDDADLVPVFELECRDAPTGPGCSTIPAMRCATTTSVAVAAMRGSLA